MFQCKYRIYKNITGQSLVIFFLLSKRLAITALKGRRKNILKKGIKIFGVYSKRDYFCTRFKTERRSLREAKNEKRSLKDLKRNKKI